MTELSVIIPVFHEAKTIKEIVRRVLRKKTPKEIIIVDDGSTDGTVDIIKKLKDLKIKKFFHKCNQGKGAAIRTGIKEARGEILIIQDADLEYDPQYYSSLTKPIKNGETQVVYGTRLKTLKFCLWGKEKTPLPLHYLANLFLSLLTNSLYGSHLTDMETCYKVMTKRVYQSLKLESNRFEIEPEITAKILRAGFKIKEVAITTNPRDYNQGKKIKAGDALMAVFTLFKYRFKK